MKLMLKMLSCYKLYVKYMFVMFYVIVIVIKYYFDKYIYFFLGNLIYVD